MGDSFVASRSDLSQQGFELGEDLFDRVEVGRAFRQKHEARRRLGTPAARPVPCGSRGWIPTRSATPSTALVPQRKVGFPIPNAGLLLGFQGTKTARREGISSPFSDARGCTSRQNSGVVQDHDVARLKGGREELFDMGAEAFAVDRPVEQAGRVDAVAAQRGEEGRGLPAAMRNLVDEALPSAPSRVGGSCWSSFRSRR